VLATQWGCLFLTPVLTSRKSAHCAAASRCHEDGKLIFWCRLKELPWGPAYETAEVHGAGWGSNGVAVLGVGAGTRKSALRL